jgi:hypothetical protein
MTLEAACNELLNLAATLSGITRKYADPPETVNEFPAVMVYPMRGNIELLSAGMSRSFHVIALDIIQTRQYIATAVRAAMTWPDLVSNMLRTYPNLNGTVAHIASVSYRIGPIRYGQDVLFGARFELTVKVMEG